MTPKERNLLKGAIRRVFSRSELRRKVIEASIIEHADPKRPRVRKWSRCNICKQPTPTYLAAVDHIDPIIPVTTALEHMSWDTVVDRSWCEENNLQVCCKDCHHEKSTSENKQRRQVKKQNKLVLK